MTNSDTAIAWVQGLQARGVTLAVRNGRLWLQPASAYKALSDAELIVLRHHRQAIKNAVAFGVLLPASPTPPPEPKPELEPTPEILARVITDAGLITESVRRLTEADVREALRMLGDDALADYDAGRLSKAAAYDIAGRRNRDLLGLCPAHRTRRTL